MKAMLLILVAFGVGIGTLGYGLVELANAYASTDWPVATGTVVSSSVVASRTKSGTNYKPQITFSYEVDGTAHSSDTWSYKDIARSRVDADAIARRYPPNGTVQVHYDPASPGSAVLETGAGFETFMLPGFGVVLLLFGVFLVFRRLRRT